LIAAIAEAAVAKAKASEDQALIVHLKLEIEKLKRTIYGPRSERTARLLLDQMELRLEELEASAAEDEIAAEQAVAKTTKVAAFSRKRPARKPFLSICLVNAWSFQGRRFALVAAAIGCANWVRT